MLVQVKGVTKTFTKRESSFLALTDVDLEIAAGEFIALVGTSGCGKSTLLRIMAGLTPPSTGTVTIDGTAVKGPRLDIGMMFQQSTLLPWRDVIGNILLPLEIQRKVTATDVARAEELLSVVQLDGFGKHYAKELSGGMQQRVALSRTMITDPTIMLLDEPFGALDEFTREALNIELAGIVAAGRRTVVLVTHSIEEAVFLADRVITMSPSPGRLVEGIAVPFARPRSASIMLSPEFRDIEQRVRTSLGLQ